MAENAAHGPGTGPVKAHKGMAGATSDSDFGVSKYPGRGAIASPNAGAVMGKTLSDADRACAPAVDMGRRSMDAQRHPDHGPHGVPRAYENA